MEIDFRVHPTGEYIMLKIEAPVNLPSEGNENPEKILINKVAIQSYENYTVSYPEEPEYEIEINEDYFARRVDLDFIKKTGLYYLYIQLSSEQESCSDCHTPPVIAAVDLHSLYNIAVNSLKKIDCNSCNSQEYDRLVDLIVKHEIFERALKICDFSTANQLWCDIIKYDWDKGRCRDSLYSKNRT